MRDINKKIDDYIKSRDELLKRLDTVPATISPTQLNSIPESLTDERLSDIESRLLKLEKIKTN